MYEVRCDKSQDAIGAAGLAHLRGLYIEANQMYEGNLISVAIGLDVYTLGDQGASIYDYNNKHSPLSFEGLDPLPKQVISAIRTHWAKVYAAIFSE